ncbi:Bacteriophage lambda, GpH, tail tape measure, N-terminal [uncultured Caudovirales phage]|uniref:Bacteriophage lambda, GpH, tail tape measure, N-terminal n=1 Tax=uncultured Caudovirales phage TaxID=2100421 RepID=A0A6J5P027_9CAUD|nr:Bacteriophage lambda, GpH, tail tape measure, N-terminal [uncultured Caudovirales phage]
MTDKKIGIGIVVDGSQAQDGMQRVAQASREMAAAVKQSGDQAGKGLDNVGAGGDQAATKVDRATKSIINSIQRTTTQLEAGGKASAKYYELLASQRNINADALKPYIDQLRAVEGAQKSVGISAAQTSAAMRNVPAQFTDIITSLQGGQQPLTVFIQQGGQLKDMFGGIAPAAKALGGYIVGLINPFTLAAAAVAGLGYVYAQADDRAREFAKSIINSGNAAGTSADQLIDLSRRIADAGTASNSLASDALNGLVSTGNVSASVLEKAAQAAIKGQKYLGMTVEDNVKAFSDLGKDPVKALESLNNQYNFLTTEVYKQVRALEDQGKTAEAAKVAQNAFADAIESRSASIKENLSAWAKLWGEIKNAASGAADAVGTAFDKPTMQQELKRLNTLKGSYESYRENPENSGERNSQLDTQIAAIKNRIDAVNQMVKADQSWAKAEEDAANKARAGNEFLRQGEQFLSKKAQQEREIAKATQLRADALGKSIEEVKNDEELTKRIAAIKEKYKESVSKEASAYATLSKSISEKLALSYLEISSGEKLNDAQKLKVKLNELEIASNGKIAKSKSDKTRAEIAELDVNLRNIEYAKKSSDEMRKLIDSMGKEQESIKQQIATQNEYNAKIGATKEAIAALEIAKLNDIAAGKDQNAQMLEAIGLETDLIQRLREQANEYRELARAKQIGSDKTKADDDKKDEAAAAKKALGEIQREADRFYADIYNGLSDSLYRGFEAGKGFFQNFWDGIKNLFKTTVLKLAVQGVMTGVFGGLAGTASAATGGNPLGSVFNAVSAGKSLYEGFTAAGTLGNGFWGSLAGGLNGAGAGSGLTSSLGLSIGNSIQSTLGTSLSGSISSGLSSIAAAMPYAAAAAAVFAISKSVNGGYRLGGLSADAGAALGFAPRLFGMQDKQMAGQTITGALGTDNLMRNVSWTQKGGLFRSDRSGVWSYGLKDSTAIQDGKAYQDTANVANDSAMLKGINDSYAALKTATTDFAKTLGLNAADIAARNDQIQFTLGSTADETQANLAKALTAISNSMADSVLGGLASLKAAGEESGTTLARLADVVRTADAAVAIFGRTGEQAFGSLSESSIAARDAFVKLNGGVDALKASTEYFAQNFLTDTERLAPVAEELHKQMSALGYGSVTTVEGFKNLVKGLDLTNSSQAGLYAELLKLAPAFKAVADAAKTSVDEVALAKQALDGARSTYQTALRAVADSLATLSQKAVAAAQTEAAARAKISQAYFAAQDDFAAAQQRVLELTRASAEAMTRFSTNLKTFVAGLGGTIEGKSYESLKASLQTSAVLAQGGDAKSQSDLTAIAQQFLNASKARSSDAAGYLRDEASVKVLLSSVADAVDAQVRALDLPAASTDVEKANKELVDAQKKMIALAELSLATGANTERTLNDIAGYSAALLAEFKQAQAENAKAQADLLSARAITAGVALPDTSSLSGFFTLVAQLGTAKEALDKAQENLNAEILIAAKKATQTVGDFAASLGLTGDSATLLAKAMKDANLSTDGFKALMSITGLSAKDLATELTASGASASDMAIILARAGTDGEKFADRLRLAGISADQFAAMLRENGLQADSLAIIFDTSKAAAKVLADSLGVPSQAAQKLADALGGTSDIAQLYRKTLETAGGSLSEFDALMLSTGLSAKDLATILNSSGASAQSMAQILARAGVDGERLADRLRLAGVTADQFAAILRANGLQADSLSIIFDTSKEAAQKLADSLGVPSIAAKTLAEALATSTNSSLDYKQALEKAGSTVTDLNVILKNSAINAGDLFQLLSLTGGSATLLSGTLQNTGISADSLADAFGVAKANTDSLASLLKISNSGTNADDLAKSIEASQRSAQDFFAILGAAKLSASNLTEIVQVTGLSAAAILAVLGTSDQGLQGVAIAAGGSLRDFRNAAFSAGVGLTQFDSLLRASGLTVDSFEGLRKLANASSGEMAGYLNLATLTSADLSTGFTNLRSSLGSAADAASEVAKLLKSFNLPDLGNTGSFNTAAKSLAQQVVEDWYRTNKNAIKTPDLEGVAYWVQEIEKNGIVAAKTAFANSVAITTNTKPIPIDQFSEPVAPTLAPSPILFSNDSVVVELKAVRDELVALRSEQTAGDIANIDATAETTKLLNAVVKGQIALTTKAV